MHIYSFEKLEVWKEAIQLAVSTYKMTELFPNEEKFGLISQMRRSSVSVMTIAYSSTLELLNQAIISKELDFISKENYLDIRKDIESITNKINSLRNHFLKS